jgi:cytoskeletal protein CcmA (bactofilin family)
MIGDLVNFLDSFLLNVEIKLFSTLTAGTAMVSWSKFVDTCKIVVNVMVEVTVDGCVMVKNGCVAGAHMVKNGCVAGAHMVKNGCVAGYHFVKKGATKTFNKVKGLFH